MCQIGCVNKKGNKSEACHEHVVTADHLRIAKCQKLWEDGLRWSKCYKRWIDLAKDWDRAWGSGPYYQ